jgi:hypothetical protein
MGEVTGAKKRRLDEEEREAVDDLNSSKKIRRPEEERTELVDDRISLLPDDVLGDIVSLLPSKDGARTQVLSSRWRPIWRSAPLNFDFHDSPFRGPRTASEIGSILSSHHGPGRRFTIHMGYVRRKYYDADAAAAAADAAETLDAWLQCPALNNLQVLQFSLITLAISKSLPPFPASVHRFSSTLRVASFRACSFPDGNASALHLPLLNQLSLVDVRISETSLHALLAGCSALESLLLKENNGFPRVQIVSTSLRSIGVCSPWGDNRLRQLIIEDAPCLERLLIFRFTDTDISVISAPRLKILGSVSSRFPRLQFGTTTFQVPASF